MTIDERLENISQQLEILTGMQHANERRFAEISTRSDRHGERLEDIDQRLANVSQQLEILTGMQHANERRFTEIGAKFDEITRIFAQEHASIVSLENIAQAHEERLDDLEGE